MNIKLNGKNENISYATVYDLVSGKGLNLESVVVEYNYKILKMDKWKDTQINENDNIEIVSFVGGG